MQNNGIDMEAYEAGRKYGEELKAKDFKDGVKYVMSWAGSKNRKVVSNA